MSYFENSVNSGFYNKCDIKKPADAMIPMMRMLAVAKFFFLVKIALLVIFKISSAS